jgi:peroxiredoxin
LYNLRSFKRAEPGFAKVVDMSHLLNRFAPDFMLPGVGGGRFALSDWRGQIIVLNFWSAECPWSRRADVALVYRQLSWDSKGVRIVGIASNANEKEIQLRSEVQARHLKYPVLLDGDRSVATLYQAKTTPHFFVIDRQSYVRYSGALDDVTRKGQKPSTIYLDEAVQALLANRPPNPLTTAPFGSPLVFTGSLPKTEASDSLSATSKITRPAASGAEPPPADPAPTAAAKPPTSPAA